MTVREADLARDAENMGELMILSGYVPRTEFVKSFIWCNCCLLDMTTFKQPVGGAIKPLSLTHGLNI